MKFFYSPGACSLSIHTLLEEIGRPYEAEEISLRKKVQFTPAYLAINPKAQVPALRRDDGSVLTELVAIAVWLAETNPALKLLPKNPEDMGRVLEAMLHIVTNVHPQGFTRIYRTDKFASNEAEYEPVRAKGREIVKEGVERIDESLNGGPFFLDHLTIADFAIFYIEYWTTFRLKWELPARCAVHYAAMMQRPSVQRTLTAENYPFQER